ncbi:Adaptive-response sensory-kinase SasA [Nocardia sp. RB20]|uniref:Sensor histidine kinase MtrB n=1 Tax=Nocardia macrotermitis TaxID=2585198 RepID=A0A7K0D2Q0_9NOCA|nr:Adaptive-response sensory-kinase SasA [Nocardia macrotermitis]
MIDRSRNRVERLLAAMVAWFKTVGESLGHVWRRSLQLRVVVSTLTLSLIVITILGVVLTSQITDRLLDGKIAAAVEEMARARATVDSQISGARDSNTQATRLQSARSALSIGNSGPSGSEAGSFDSALVMVGENMQEISAGPVQEVPNELRRFVRQGQVSYQFATVSDLDGYHGRVLVIGSPSTAVPTLEVYLIFQLTNEDRSLSLMRGTMFIGGGVLLVLLAAIAMLVTRQVVLPIRSAARIAGRFADGRLKERMLVRGEDDMAKLAISFNAMAESLSNQITQLEEFGNLQRRFTSDVSHELRTPLTTVRMAADLIHGSSDELDPALARSAELLVTELDRFEGLLNDLLEISRHDAGVAELQVESLDVRMCARAAISTVRHLAKESGVEVVVDLPEEPLVAEVDPRRVERVLRNLLANAIDHSEGKPVLLRMRGDAEVNSVAIVVRDQGVGLRPGEEKLVFNRFWRSDPSRMRRSGGTGLGLSISVEDANLHEGKLEAWGELGAGASFRLTLPLVRGRKMGVSPLPLEPPKRRTAQLELTERAESAFGEEVDGSDLGDVITVPSDAIRSEAVLTEPNSELLPNVSDPEPDSVSEASSADTEADSSSKVSSSPDTESDSSSDESNSPGAESDPDAEVSSSSDPESDSKVSGAADAESGSNSEVANSPDTESDSSSADSGAGTAEAVAASGAESSADTTTNSETAGTQRNSGDDADSKS